jgi:hypothetical protein
MISSSALPQTLNNACNACAIIAEELAEEAEEEWRFLPKYYLIFVV